MTKQEVEFEIEYGEGRHPGIDTFHVHVRCFAAWEFERTLADA